MDDTAWVVGALLVTLLIVMAVVSQVAMIAAQITGGGEKKVDVLMESGSGAVPQLISNDKIFGVTSSLNDSVALTGSEGSAVEFPTPINVDGTWTACTLGKADSAVVSGDESRALLGISDVVVEYNGSQDTWRAWYYNDSTAASTDVSAPAPSPTQWTLVCASKNSTHLRIAVNGTARHATQLATTGIAPDPASANWNGKLDETRLFSRLLNQSQRTHYYSKPTIGVSGPAPAGRIKYDVWNRQTSTVPLYWASGDADLSESTVTDGLLGERLVRGTDWKRQGSSIVALSGYIDGRGDVVHVRHGGRGQFALFLPRLFNIVSSMITLLAIGAVVIAAQKIMDVWGGGGL